MKTAREWKEFYARERAELGQDGMSALLDRARPELEGILALAPKAITLHPVAQSREVWLRFRGLPFALVLVCGVATADSAASRTAGK